MGGENGAGRRGGGVGGIGGAELEEPGDVDQGDEEVTHAENTPLEVTFDESRFILCFITIVHTYIIGHNYHGLYSHGHMFSRT